MTRIDFNTGTFTSNGNEYYIMGLEMPYKKLMPFFQRQSQITRGISIENAVDFIFGLHDKMKAGEDKSFKEAYLEAFATLNDFVNFAKTYDISKAFEQQQELYYKFCTYFINRGDEDENTYDERLALEKIKDWKTDVYPRDFFFAACLQLKLSTQKSEDSLKELGILQ